MDQERKKKKQYSSNYTMTVNSRSPVLPCPNICRGHVFITLRAGGGCGAAEGHNTLRTDHEEGSRGRGGTQYYNEYSVIVCTITMR